MESTSKYDRIKALEEVGGQILHVWDKACLFFGNCFWQLYYRGEIASLQNYFLMLDQNGI